MRRNYTVHDKLSYTLKPSAQTPRQGEVTNGLVKTNKYVNWKDKK